MKKSALIVCLMAILAMALLHSAEAINDASLVLYLSFNEGAGDTAADQSGNSNNATIEGGVDWENSGKVGSAVSFDGATGYMLAGDSGFGTMGEPGDAYTVETWIKTAQAGNITWGAPIIAEKRRQPDWERAFALYVNVNNSFGVRFENATEETLVDATDPVINDDSWHHIAVTRNGAQAALYIDGNLAASGDIGDEERSSPGEPITLGCRRKNDGTITDYFAGIIDEFAIHSRALTESEIKQDMNGGVLSAVEPSGKIATTWANIKNH